MFYLELYLKSFGEHFEIEWVECIKRNEKKLWWRRKKTTMKDKKKLCKRNSYSLFVTVKIIKFGNANIRLICTNNATHRCIEN